MTPKLTVQTPYGFAATRRSARAYKFVVVFESMPRSHYPLDKPGTWGWSQSRVGAEKMARAAGQYCDGVLILPVEVAA